MRRITTRTYKNIRMQFERPQLFGSMTEQMQAERGGAEFKRQAGGRHTDTPLRGSHTNQIYLDLDHDIPRNRRIVSDWSAQGKEIPAAFIIVFCFL